MTSINLRSLWRPSGIVLLVYLVLILAISLSNEQGAEVFHSGGRALYDGFYFYHIALSPLDVSPHLDHPAYRYQRILYPMLARLTGLGHPLGISYALLLLNLAALTVSTELLGRLLESWGASRWYALVFGLFIGQLVALRFDTSEPLCFLLVLGGIFATERKHLWEAVFLFALAMLTKELALVFIAAYAIAYLIQRRWLESAAMGLALAPYVALQFGIWLWLGEPALVSGPGGAVAPLPFAGYLQRGFTPAAALLPLVLLLPAIFGAIIGAYHTVKKWPLVDPIPLALLLNALLIIMLPSEASGAIRAAGRIGTGLVLAMLLTGGRLGFRRILNYSILWIPLSAIYIPSLAFAL